MLMGAGVIAIMGISFPLPFTLLILVLLAVYDFISVYKTKHMIALADSVVEAKMPILLVFPMKWSYRYEDETNLMDPKRKRESLFMGLGDVIIPGILILSAATFLSPVGGIRLFGFIYPPVAVALFALVGMLVGWGSLMFFVIRGKAHAGLPPINSGTILGFIIGMLVVYGTVVFW
jgi:presenilin-like A22 family membrane protease